MRDSDSVHSISPLLVGFPLGSTNREHERRLEKVKMNKKKFTPSSLSPVPTSVILALALFLSETVVYSLSFYQDRVLS
jgi:hypothetical protein